MKPFFKTRLACVAGASAIATLLVAGIALASSYEWIKGIQVPSTVGSFTYTTTTWDTKTSGTYYEYRSLYYTTSTSPYDWHEWTECRTQGNVTTEVTDGCVPIIPGGDATTTLYIRASTNYSGCGTWTPTPDETTCGGTLTTSVTVLPW